MARFTSELLLKSAYKRVTNSQPVSLFILQAKQTTQTLLSYLNYFAPLALKRFSCCFCRITSYSPDSVLLGQLRMGEDAGYYRPALSASSAEYGENQCHGCKMTNKTRL